MKYHYETTCVPSPTSWYLHHLPEAWHTFEVAANHAVQLGFPWLLMLGRRARIVAGLAMCSEMVMPVVILQRTISE